MLQEDRTCFDYTWKSFDTFLQGNLEDLFSENRFSDVILVSDDQVPFHAHKFVLGSSSSVLKDLLITNPHPSPLIYMRGFYSLELKAILEFMYLGRTQIKATRIDKLFVNCKSLQIEKLMSEEALSKVQNVVFDENESLSINGTDVVAKPTPSYNIPSVRHNGFNSLDLAKRRVVGEEWAPSSFSSTFTCLFCFEQFSKDYQLKLHLLMTHKDQPKDLMEKAQEELIKAKLDGCVHMCALCNNKFKTIASISRHLRDVHEMSRQEYQMQYGDSEIVKRMFTCELCNKDIKHTRSIIGSHMKLVHLISWKEYQEIVLKMKTGGGNFSLPNPEMFNCLICGVSVKFKKEHLNKKHLIDEDIYEELVIKKEKGEDISENVPGREVFTCAVCARECMDLKRHLNICHKLTLEQYSIEFCEGEAPRGKVVKQDFNVEGAANKSINSSSGIKRKKVKKEKGEEVEYLSTDLQCYFNCEETFKKDYELHLHLKIHHRNEEPGELEKAYTAANEEVAFTRRSASVYTCAMCPRVYNDYGAFTGHIKKGHSMSYQEYKEKYGRCETETQPFECKICCKVLKYERNTVHTHLKNVHGLNWVKYLDRIRKLRRGLEPDPLPVLKLTNCHVCNTSVKYLKDHIKNAHKLTEKEYHDLFGDEIKDEPFPNDLDLNPVSEASKEEKNTKSEINSFYTNDISSGSKAGSNNRSVFDSIKKEIPDPADLKTLRPPKKDIQDKANKSCSVCEVTFESRKFFIEHCQLTHGMRFKTKTGVSIPKPLYSHVI